MLSVHLLYSQCAHQLCSRVTPSAMQLTGCHFGFFRTHARKNTPTGGRRRRATCGRSHMPAEGCRAGSARQSFVLSLLRCECRLKRLESPALRLYGSDHRQFTCLLTGCRQKSNFKPLLLTCPAWCCVIKSDVYISFFQDRNQP